MVLELRNVVVPTADGGRTPAISAVAAGGRVTCLTGASAVTVLRAMMGFVSPVEGIVSIDGEPLTAQSAETMRQLMAYVPERLEPIGHYPVYEPPVTGNLLQLAEARQTPLLMVAAPDVPADWLRHMALQGRTVVVATDRAELVAGADDVVRTDRTTK